MYNFEEPDIIQSEVGGENFVHYNYYNMQQIYTGVCTRQELDC
jgi:hypothetical protein